MKGTLSAPRLRISIRSLLVASRSLSPRVSKPGNASKPSLTMEQIKRSFSISASLLIIRSARITGAPSVMSSPGSASRTRSRSMMGMRNTDSRPSSAPIRPKRRGNWANASDSSETPSSSGHGACQLRTSSTQVLNMPATPISGITAMGLPSRGTTKNQGRVGLSQNCVSKPLK